MTEPSGPADAQFGPHRFYAGEGGGNEEFRGARFDVADLRGARFTDCDLTGVTIRDGWLVGVNISGYVSSFVLNGVDVTDFVDAELDRRHPERVQFRQGQTADDVRGMWDTIERLWENAVERAGRLPAAALAEEVSEEWSFEQTLRHLIFITDAWASRTLLDEPMPYHTIGVPQSWFPAVDATALGIDLAAQPDYAEILAVRADRMAVVRRIVDGLTDDDLGRPCHRTPAPGYPDEERSLIECIGVVMDEEIEHYRFAVRDLAVLEARLRPPEATRSLPVFDCGALFTALDAQRRDRGLGWYELADELWQQSSDLNAQRSDHPLCGGAVQRLHTRGATSCQYALFMLRWLRRAPEDFLSGPVVDVGNVRLPRAGTDSRLRWNLNQLHAALNDRRRERALTWADLAQELNCTPSRLTNLRTARLADMDLAMRVTQWLGQPAAAFIHPAQW
jgi:hypothetical protein